MISASNTDEIAKQLDEFSKEVQRKLTNMVAGFAREVALTASRNTPVGDLESMMTEHSRYRSYYLDRQDAYGIPVEPGYHSGAWQYSEGNMTFTPVIFTANEMADDVFSEAEANYKIGDSFSIGAIGPGYADLEGGRSKDAPNGIGEPTVAEVMSAHQADLKRYYDAG